MKFHAALLLLTLLGANPAPAKDSDRNTATCQLILDGGGIESLTINGEQWRVDPASNVLRLKPGPCVIGEIRLKGGYHSAARLGKKKDDWFTLTPEQPYHLQAGAPLTPHVEVTRQGRLLKLDYELLDAGGRSYQSELRGAPPRFVIRQGGQEIAFGNFEYG